MDLGATDAANGDVLLDLDLDENVKEKKRDGTLLADEHPPAGANEEEEEVEDPWALSELEDTSTPWNGMFIHFCFNWSTIMACTYFIFSRSITICKMVF